MHKQMSFRLTGNDLNMFWIRSLCFTMNRSSPTKLRSLMHKRTAKGRAGLYGFHLRIRVYTRGADCSFELSRVDL
jgi:hypothetical protein